MRSTYLLAAGAATLRTGAAAATCSLPAGDPNMLAWVEEGVMPFFTTVSAPRILGAAGTVVDDGKYFAMFCADDWAETYSCVIKCDDGAIDYSMCGPGGAQGKGEAFVVGGCVAPREHPMNLACNVDFASDKKVLEWPCFHPDRLGETCAQSWREYWATAYAFAAEHGGTQHDKSLRYGEGDSFLPHTTGNLIKLGMAFSLPDFRKTSFATAYHGFFAEVVEDWLPTFCAAHYDSASGAMEGLDEAEVGADHFMAAQQYYESSYADICGYLDGIPTKGFSGKLDLVGNVNLFTMTTSGDVALGPQEGPYDFSGIGPASTMVGAEFLAEFPFSLIPASEWVPAGFDPSAAEGDVFWPEIGAKWACVEPFIPTGDADGDGTPECPQMMMYATTNPTSYTFDTPVQIDVVGAGSYDACDWLDENVDVFGQADSACFHMHQGGPHLRTGQMAPFYPRLLDGTPDFFGVCSSAEMEKAYYVPDANPEYPGVNYFNTGTAASAQFDLSGGVQMFHGKSYGIHFCADPDDVDDPYVCLLNKESGFKHLEGIDDQLILSPLSFVYEAYTDREANCLKSRKHYCPYDDFWMTVDDYGGVTEVRDFAAAQAACVAHGDCDPERLFDDDATTIACNYATDCPDGLTCSTGARRALAEKERSNKVCKGAKRAAACRALGCKWTKHKKGKKVKKCTAWGKSKKKNKKNKKKDKQPPAGVCV